MDLMLPICFGYSHLESILLLAEISYNISHLSLQPACFIVRCQPEVDTTFCLFQGPCYWWPYSSGFHFYLEGCFPRLLKKKKKKKKKERKKKGNNPRCWDNESLHVFLWIFLCSVITQSQESRLLKRYAYNFKHAVLIAKFSLLWKKSSLCII